MSNFGARGRAGRGHESTGESVAGTPDSTGMHPSLHNPDSVQPGPAQPHLQPEHAPGYDGNGDCGGNNDGGM